MKTMCPPGYHPNDFMEIPKFGHSMYRFFYHYPMFFNLLEKTMS